MRLESGEKDALLRFPVENFFSDIHIELPLENVEKLVLTRVHMRRRLSSRCQSCLKQREGSVGIWRFREVGQQHPHVPFGSFQGCCPFKRFQMQRCVFHFLFLLWGRGSPSDLSPASGDHVPKIELCLKSDFWA